MNQKLKIKKYYIPLFTFAFSLLTFYLACEHDFTAISSPERKIRVTVASEPGLREIYLKVEVRQVSLPQVFSLTRNDSLILQDTLTFTDTTIIDTGLNPATTYNYRAYRMVNGAIADASELLKTSTMDTTSHDFTWEIIEIASPFGSAVLQDIAIINENDIWAVGKIYADSAQPSLPYNAVHWDGQQWELKKIPFTGWCSAVQFPPIRSIFAFSENDIWFARGGSLVRYNGSTFYNDCDMNALLDGSINKIWGTDSNNLYAVGGTGSIVHYNGSSWQKIESGTDLPIQDIWGGIDPESGEEIILCVASNIYQNMGHKLLRIHNNVVEHIPDTNLPWSLAGVWFMPGKMYYVVGGGIYYKKDFNVLDDWLGGTNITNYYSASIRGLNINNIIIAGGYGDVVHYNGSTWHDYYTETALGYGNYYRVDIKNEVICAVGEDAPKAAILIGKRN